MYSNFSKIFAPTPCLTINQIIGYTDDSLSDKDRHEVEKHLLDCKLCSEAVEGFELCEEKGEVRDILKSLKQILNKLSNDES